MKRVLIGGYVFEGHSFSGGHSSLDDFRLGGYLVEGAEVLSLSYIKNGELNGIVDTLADAVELVPSVHGWANSGPPMTKSTYEYFERTILRSIRSAGALDGVALVLHGSSLAEEVDDPEGRLLKAVRRELGPRVPIVVTFDLHANVTALRAASASAIVGYATCPHTDLYETGVQAATILLGAVRDETTPVTAMHKLPMITPAPSHDTDHGPVVPVMALARRYEELPGVLSASIFLAQPWLDVPTLGNSVCVVTDGDPRLGQQIADELAARVWDLREAFAWQGTPVSEAIRQAASSPPGMVVLADGADSPTAGSNGDGNEVLSGLLDARWDESALLTIVDAAAVDTAHLAGVGAEVEVPLGGSITDGFVPLAVRAVVESLHDGEYWLEAQPKLVDIGRTAVLRVGSIVLVVSERKPFMLDASVFHHVGLEPRHFRIVQVKSAGGYRSVFEPFAARIIDLDTSGPSSSNFATLPFERVGRPLWPIDSDPERIGASR